MTATATDTTTEVDQLDQVADEVRAALDSFDQPLQDPPIGGEPPMPPIEQQATTTTEIMARASATLRRARETGPPVEPVEVRFWVQPDEAVAVLATELGSANIGHITRLDQVHDVLAEYYHRHGRQGCGVDVAGWWARMADLQNDHTTTDGQQ